MRYLTGKRIVFFVTGLLVILAIAGWFLFGSNLFDHVSMAGAPPGSTIDAKCQAVYQKVITDGFAAHRIMAEDGFKVEKALYLTGQEAKSRYDSQLSASDDARLCYLLVRGNIEVGSPFTTTVAIYPTGYAIYDLQTLYPFVIGTGVKY